MLGLSLAGRSSRANSYATDSHEFETPHSTLHHVLRGVSVAAKTSDDVAKPVSQWVSSCEVTHHRRLSELDVSASHHDGRDPDEAAIALPFSDWRRALESAFPGDTDESGLVASLTLGIAFMSEKCQQTQSAAITDVASEDLALVWDLIYNAISSPFLAKSAGDALRSSQGFLAVPLCSLIKDGNIDQLLRLHIWLPDGQRGDPAFTIHSHQSFGQSWILAGQGTDQLYEDGKCC